MANFDTKSWYQVTSGDDQDQSLVGTEIYDKGQGAVFFQITNDTNPQQQWQIYPFNSTYFVLRTNSSGSASYLSAAANSGTDNAGNTVPSMVLVTQADDSMFWQIAPWGDGTFYFTNAVNGTTWHMERRPNSLMQMSSNITAPQLGQRYSFTKKNAINETLRPEFSTLQLRPTSTSTPLPTDINSSTPAPNTSGTAIPSPESASSGLSTGAKAGIGAAIGGVVVIAAMILGIFLLKRRKRRAAEATPVPGPPAYGGDAYAKDNKHEYIPQNQKYPSEVEAPVAPSRYELSSSPMELPGQSNPMELPANDARR